MLSPITSARPGPTTSKANTAEGKVAWGWMALVVVTAVAAFVVRCYECMPTVDGHIKIQFFWLLRESALSWYDGRM